MTEFFEDKGTWAGHPVTVRGKVSIFFQSKKNGNVLFGIRKQNLTFPKGIFEDGNCIAVKVLNRTDGTPISWAFNPKGSIGSDLREGFRKMLQKLYDERRED